MRHSLRLMGFVSIPALVLAAGCAETKDEDIGPNQATLSASTVDPCAVALATHGGSDAADQTIVRLQQRSRMSVKPLAALERLGWAFIAKARASFDAGFYTLAEQTALCIASKKPGSAEALLLRGYVAHNLHRFRDAEALARELIARRGLWFDYALLGDALMEQGRLDAAIDAYQRMMDQKPGPVAYLRAAHVRWLKGDLPGAIEVMEMAGRASGGRAPEMTAWIYTRLALYELQAGRSPKASRYADWALAVQPDYPPALLARGRLLLARAEYSAAISPLTRAAASNPLPEYRWTLVEALRAAGHTAEAQAVEARLREQGAADDARTYALYLATTGHDTAAALRLARQELEIRADVFTLDTLAWALLAQGRVQEAQKFIARAVAEGTPDARLFLHAGVIAEAAGDTEEAAHWFRKATVIEHMLLPSERALLRKEFAVRQPQITTLASNRSIDQ